MMVRLYHGSHIEVKKPDIEYSKLTIDFGKGFYLTEDVDMAKKWACNRSRSVLNSYNVDLSDLRVKTLSPNKEWLDYVLHYRTGIVSKPFDDTQFDIVIGPTADDKLFTVLDMYTDGLIGDDKMIEVMNCMKLSEQVVFKNQNAIDKGLKFSESKELVGYEKQHIFSQFQHDRAVAAELTREILRRK